MFGQTPFTGPWSDQGYSRANYNEPLTDSQSETRNWNQDLYSNLDTRTSNPVWPNNNTASNSRINSSLYQTPIGHKLGLLSNTISNETNNSRSPGLWAPIPQPPPLNRKRSLPLDESDYHSNFKVKCDSWSRPEPDDWSRSESRHNDWSSSNDWNTGRSNDQDISEGGNNPRIGGNRSGTWPQSEGRPRSETWSKPNTSPWPRPPNKTFSKFTRKETSRNTQPWSRPKVAAPALDITSVIITTYYVNQKKVNMPKELTSKFGALNCDLCGVLVNSTVTARTHYTGKTHDKKVAQFMQRWFTLKGEPIPEQFKEGVPKKSSTNVEGTAVTFYCAVCDIPLTSKQHAEQHYMGKAHRKALQNGNPKKVPVHQDQPDPTGRFKIGEKFIQASDPLGLKVPTPLDQSTVNNSNPLFCKLCNVMATSPDQLATHLSGARHQKKLKAAANPVTDILKVPPPADSILATLNRPHNSGQAESRDPAHEKKKDFSIFRTPSGCFYCATCNLTMNSEMQFGQHNDSKKHKLNVAKVKNVAKPPSTITNVMKPEITCVDISQ